MIFIDNKYTRIYFQIIDRAKSRNITGRRSAKKLLGYSEKHHIVPRCIGGSDHKDNLIYLTAREHFVCHWLLVKMTDRIYRERLVLSLCFMRSGTKLSKTHHRYDTKISSRVFEKYRSEIADIMREVQLSKVRDGTHHLLSGDIQRKSNKKRIEDGTHNWAGENHPKFDTNSYLFEHKKTGQRVTMTRAQFIQEFKVAGSYLSEVINGRQNRKSIKGWKIIDQISGSSL